MSILLPLVCVAFAVSVLTGPAQAVQPRFDLSDPQTGPFPADRFTVVDGRQLTGLRVDLPKPDCDAQPSDCDDVDVLNQLDGFNLQPRLSIPFTGPIDLTTVSSETVLLCRLQGGICPGAASVIGINQVVWDPETDTLYAESGRFLDQGASYLLAVTNGIRDPAGDRIDSDEFQDVLHFGSTYTDELLTAVRSLKNAGIPLGRVAAASVFTTQSATALMEKIREQLDAATPAAADFRLGPNGERTVFPLAEVRSIALSRQVTTAPTFQTTPVYPLRTAGGLPDGLDVVNDQSQGQSPVGTVAFGSYFSPDYENADGMIPAVGTRTGVPRVQTTNQIYFNLFLPSGPEPAGGWPVVIAGHGRGGNKNGANNPIRVAAKFAEHGLATIAINAVGHGGGPLGMLTVTKTDASTVTLPAGGRTVDQDRDGTYGPDEGVSTAPGGRPAIVYLRDGFRQTAVDLMQLVREIQVGIDVVGDSARDLNPAGVYYFGTSLGGVIGTPFVALEPDVGAGVLGGTGGSFIDLTRLGIAGRDNVGELLCLRNPPLANGGPDPVLSTNPCPFRENLPLRNQPPVVNDVAGAIPIQEEIERVEWADQSGDPVAYAPHLRKALVLFSFAQGDPVVTNTTTATILRAGDLKDRTMYFRGRDAYAANHRTPTAQDLHEFLFRLNTDDPFRRDTALAAQESIDRFLASGGQVTVNPVTPPAWGGPWFETPMAGPLPGER